MISDAELWRRDPPRRTLLVRSFMCPVVSRLVSCRVRCGRDERWETVKVAKMRSRC